MGDALCAEKRGNSEMPALGNDRMNQKGQCKALLHTSENILLESELAIVIDEWYADWRDHIADFQTRTHSLGFAKEDLKRRIAEYPFE